MSQKPKLTDLGGTSELFAHRAANFFHSDGVLTITWATFRPDETLAVTGRVSLPLKAARLLHEDLGRFLLAAKAQDSTTPSDAKN